VHRAIAGIAAGLALLLATAALGFGVATRLWPERLRSEAEERLSRAAGTPVSIGSLRVSFGLGIEIEAFDVRVWPSPTGARLQVPRVSARPRILPLMIGRLRLRRLVLDGARLHVERTRSGSWEPPPLAALARDDDRRERPHPDELLGPLIALEVAARSLLEQPRLADTLAIRNGGVAFRDAQTDVAHAAGPTETPVALVAQGLHGQLRHRRLYGDTHLDLRARIFDATGVRGSIEWDGQRGRDGSIRLAVAASSLQLPIVAPYVRALHPGARLDGSVSGTVAYATPTPGEGRFELDLVVRDFRTQVPPPERGAFGPIEVPHARATGALEITPRGVRLESAQIDGVDLHLEAEGVVERPLQSSSLAHLSLEFRNVALEEARDYLGWFPDEEREDLAARLEPVQGGRLLTLTSRGAATLAGWRELFAGRTLTLPLGFAGEAEVADVRVRVGEANRLEELSGRFVWSGDRVDIRDARADLNGRPLPKLDLTLEGVSNLFAAPAEFEPVAIETEPLRGLRPLWAVLRRDAGSADRPEGTPAPMPTTVHLEIDVLAHPVFLWPIDDLSALIVTRDRGLHIVTNQANWRGVPIQGDADWIFEPEETLSVRLAAAPRPVDADAAAADPANRDAQPQAGPRGTNGEPKAVEGLWARGRFSIGAMVGPRWRQTRAVGRFTGVGRSVEIADVQIDLVPSGRLVGSARLDLTHPDAVPGRLGFSVADGDVATLSAALGLASGWASGQVELSGAFEGSLRPELSPFAEVSGEISLRATDGVLRQKLSPMVAIVLASGPLNPFAGRDKIRYSRIETLLEFSDGRMRTRSFSLDGPDVRVLVEGEVDLAHPLHAVDADVALFLFRQLDLALGKIPLLGVLLLGTDAGMLAAHYRLSGPWAAPEAKLIPLRSIVTGPGGIVLETGSKLLGVPQLMLKGIEELLKRDGGEPRVRPPQPTPPENPAGTPGES